MKLSIVSSQEEGITLAYQMLADAILGGAKTLGLATGATPIPLYQKLVASDLDFSDVVACNLDEYVGLAAHHPQSYAFFMAHYLFSRKPFKAHYIPNGAAAIPQEEAKRYDELLQENPIDLQVLGLGENGHIGFNEPGTLFEETTHVVNLAPSTIAANSRFFDNEADVPKQAITMGLANIMASQSVLLLAFGAKKAKAVKGMIDGNVTQALPASVLQRHSSVHVIVDQEAAVLVTQ